MFHKVINNVDHETFLVIHTYGSDRQADKHEQPENRQSYQTHVSMLSWTKEDDAKLQFVFRSFCFSSNQSICNYYHLGVGSRTWLINIMR